MVDLRLRLWQGIFSWATDVDLAEEAVVDRVDERFTEEDFDEELGAPTEVIDSFIEDRVTVTYLEKCC